MNGFENEMRFKWRYAVAGMAAALIQAIAIMIVGWGLIGVAQIFIGFFCLLCALLTNLGRGTLSYHMPSPTSTPYAEQELPALPRIGGLATGYAGMSIAIVALFGVYAHFFL